MDPLRLAAAAQILPQHSPHSIQLFIDVGAFDPTHLEFPTHEQIKSGISALDGSTNRLVFPCIYRYDVPTAPGSAETTPVSAPLGLVWPRGRVCGGIRESTPAVARDAGSPGRCARPSSILLEVPMDAELAQQRIRELVVNRLGDVVETVPNLSFQSTLPYYEEDLQDNDAVPSRTMKFIPLAHTGGMIRTAFINMARSSSRMASQPAGGFSLGDLQRSTVVLDAIPVILYPGVTVALSSNPSPGHSPFYCFIDTVLDQLLIFDKTERAPFAGRAISTPPKLPPAYTYQRQTHAALVSVPIPSRAIRDAMQTTFHSADSMQQKRPREWSAGVVEDRTTASSQAVVGRAGRITFRRGASFQPPTGTPFSSTSGGSAGGTVATLNVLDDQDDPISVAAAAADAAGSTGPTGTVPAVAPAAPVGAITSALPIGGGDAPMG